MYDIRDSYSYEKHQYIKKILKDIDIIDDMERDTNKSSNHIIIPFLYQRNYFFLINFQLKLNVICSNLIERE